MHLLSMNLLLNARHLDGDMALHAAARVTCERDCRSGLL